METRKRTITDYIAARILQEHNDKKEKETPEEQLERERDDYICK